MNNVKNNHDAPLAIAGVTIAAGATVGVDSGALRASLNSNGVKQWIKLGVIDIEDLDEGSDEPVVLSVPVIPSVPTIPSATSGGEKTPERLALEARANELGVKGVVANFKDETLAKKVTEAEAAAE